MKKKAFKRKNRRAMAMSIMLIDKSIQIVSAFTELAKKQIELKMLTHSEKLDKFPSGGVQITEPNKYPFTPPADFPEGQVSIVNGHSKAETNTNARK